jgi:hypothetical protein
MSNSENSKTGLEWLRIFLYSMLGIAIIGFAIIVGSSVTSWFCDGPCAIKRCTPANPCTLNNQQYTAGFMCAPMQEGEVCDAGIIFDCYCKTLIVRGANPPELTCKCTR